MGGLKVGSPLALFAMLAEMESRRERPNAPEREHKLAALRGACEAINESKRQAARRLDNVFGLEGDADR